MKSTRNRNLQDNIHLATPPGSVPFLYQCLSPTVGVRGGAFVLGHADWADEPSVGFRAARAAELSAVSVGNPPLGRVR